MKSRILMGVFVVWAGVAFSGCIAKEEYRKVVRRNEIQQERIRNLEAAQEEERLRADKIQREYDLFKQTYSLTQEQIAAMQAALNAKEATIDELAGMIGKNLLPVELSSALAEWARQSGSDLVVFDEETGSVRFKSDLLFDKGSDQVAAAAREQLVKLSQILNTDKADGFDVLILGHTDDIPIRKPGTRAKHPTNLHLSAHRSISVQRVMAEARLDPTRMFVMGCGEYQPMAINLSGNKGNPANRRVEIYIVPSGQFDVQTKTAAADINQTVGP